MANKILIVDDSEDMRELMTSIFVPEGYIVSEAVDGQEALCALESESPPDLIFLDYNMDGMSGPEFLREFEFRYPDFFARIPVILLTGYEPDQIVEKRAKEIVGKQAGVYPLISLAKRYLH